MNNLSYRELQQQLAIFREEGYEVNVALNAKKSLLLYAYELVMAQKEQDKKKEQLEASKPKSDYPMYKVPSHLGKLPVFISCSQEAAERFYQANAEHVLFSVKHTEETTTNPSLFITDFTYEIICISGATIQQTDFTYLAGFIREEDGGKYIGAWCKYTEEKLKKEKNSGYELKTAVNNIDDMAVIGIDYPVELKTLMRCGITDGIKFVAAHNQESIKDPTLNLKGYNFEVLVSVVALHLILSMDIDVKFIGYISIEDARKLRKAWEVYSGDFINESLRPEVVYLERCLELNS